jgi:hypothetical protein
MQRRFKSVATGLVAAGLLALAGAASPAALATSCPSGFTSATINHAHKCLHAGEYCSRNDQGKYRRYHYACRVVRGVYRLEHS